jgi:methionyl-tRNA synthetase
MAAELPLPKHIIAHAHWTVGRAKMSKRFGPYRLALVAAGACSLSYSFVLSVTMLLFLMRGSAGNVIDPAEEMATYGIDAVRFFLLKGTTVLQVCRLICALQRAGWSKTRTTRG